MEPSKIPYQNILDNLQTGVYRSSANGRGQFLFVNKAFSKMLGCGLSEIVGLKSRDVFIDV